MKFCVIAYGDVEKWGPLYERFLASFREFHDEPLVVVTDGSPRWDRYQTSTESVRLYPDAQDHMTVSHLNMSGILMAYAAIHHAPCFAMTLDCEVCNRIHHGDWTHYALAVGKDPLNRWWKLSHGRAFLEKNVATLWFGSPEPGERFLREWARQSRDNRIHQTSFWEQVVWSKVYDDMRYDACEYEPALNWSRMWPQDDERVIVLHRHGEAKWDTRD